jgi:putative hydrolase of the HAD superfamily
MLDFALPRAILFDLDDTLHDRRASVEAFIPALFAHLEPWLGGASLEAFRTVLHRVDYGGYVPRDHFMQRLLEAFGARDFDAVHLAGFWRREFAKHAQVMDGARELLEWLRWNGIKTGIVTNGTMQLQQAKIDALELRVDAVVISEAIGAKKPAAQPFLEALRLLEVSAQDAWFVGDHPVNDIEGAMQVGMQAFWLEHEQKSTKGSRTKNRASERTLSSHQRDLSSRSATMTLCCAMLRSKRR